MSYTSFCYNRAKKKGMNQPCCRISVSPNTCIITTAKPTPEGVSIRFLLLNDALNFGDFDAHQVEANTSFSTMSVLLSYVIPFIFFAKIILFLYTTKTSGTFVIFLSVSARSLPSISLAGKLQRKTEGLQFQPPLYSKVS